MLKIIQIIFAIVALTLVITWLIVAPITLIIYLCVNIVRYIMTSAEDEYFKRKLKKSLIRATILEAIILLSIALLEFYSGDILIMIYKYLRMFLFLLPELLLTVVPLAAFILPIIYDQFEYEYSKVKKLLWKIIFVILVVFFYSGTILITFVLMAMARA